MDELASEQMEIRCFRLMWARKHIWWIAKVSVLPSISWLNMNHTKRHCSCVE